MRGGAGRAASVKDVQRRCKAGLCGYLFVKLRNFTKHEIILALHDPNRLAGIGCGGHVVKQRWYPGARGDVEHQAEHPER